VSAHHGLLTVSRLAGQIGAVATGVDLTQELDRATLRTIHHAVLDHKVVFFPAQHDLDHAAQIAFAARFGEPIPRARPQQGGELDAFPQIWTISPQADIDAYGIDHEQHYRSRHITGISGWHTDLSTAVNPPKMSVLRAAVIPSHGGDTQWTNLEAAYAGLPAPLQALADRLEAEHDFFAAYDMRPHDPTDAAILDQVGDPPIAVHPVVSVHPETRRRALFVNPARVSRILEASPRESRHLLGLWFQEVTRPEYTVRWAWSSGDVAIWDNRSTAHLGIGDYTHTGEPRRLHRVTLLGDTIAGPQGQRSRAVSGRVLAAHTV
jgi:taurine dioxygenase